MEFKDAAPEQIREVYARFGLAMYQAQCVERQIAILLATCFNPNFAKSSPTDRDRAFDTEFEQTLGRLILRLSQRVRIPSDLADRMKRALEIRNLLAHNYFWERSAQFLSARGRRSMIDELTAYGSEFNALDATLTDVGRRWSARVGLAEEIIEAELRKLRDAGDV
jgi:hypothetical protein